MNKIGIVAGSFDPITNGHVWLIKKAAEMVGQDGKLFIAIGKNPAKKYFFDAAQRMEQIRIVLMATLPASLWEVIEIDYIENDLLINYAYSKGAKYIFRGIRNTEDFNYESQILNVNRKINPKVETVFFIPPFELIEVSSSTVKGLVGFTGWERIVEQYVHHHIIGDLNRKLLS